MSFIERMEEVCRKILARMDKVVGNEQATKDALIRPFFNALGIDTEDPDCWRPEYNADFPGRKKSEKVDYAVLKNGEAVMFIEAKPFTSSETVLSARDGQLARYFNATPSVKVSVITNGVLYRFFTDLDRENIQDEQPFLTIDVRNVSKAELEQLEMFSPAKFELKAIRAWADDHKNNLKAGEFLKKILANPEQSVEFVRFVLDQTYDGIKSKSVVESFQSKIPKLMRDAIDACIKARLGLVNRTVQETNQSEQKEPSNVTTVHELTAFTAARAILAGSGRDVTTVLFKDFAKWFNISQGKAGNWFLRLYFNENPKTMLIRIPVASASALYGSSTDLEQQGSSTRVKLDDKIDLVPFTKLICEAFDTSVSGRSRADEDSAEEEPLKNAS